MADSATANSGIATPCSRVCVLDPQAGLCIGCGRSLAEIAGWASLTAAARATIMAQLPARLAAVGNGAAARGLRDG